jgi:hypothetical protein
LARELLEVELGELSMPLLLRKTRIGKLSLIIMIRSKVIGLVTIALVTTTLNNNRLT